MWSFGANSPSIAESVRTPLKMTAMVAAVAVYVALVVHNSRRLDQGWREVSAVSAAGAVALGALLVVGSSLLWNRGHLFHDVEVIDHLFLLIGTTIIAAVIAALLAPLIGAIARRHPR